jgi:hypothetical protein
MSGIGDFVHLVSLAKAGPTPDDPEGGYDRTWIALDPPTWYCSISAASARDLEQISGGLYAATATHLIRGRYHPQLAPDCRITFRDRVFEVASVQNQDQQQDLLLVVATELIGVAPVAPLPPQPPAAHAPTHQPGGTDPIGPQVPAAHAATHASGGTDPLPAQPAAAHAPTHQPGGTDPIGPQIPTAHAATHATGGTDPLPAPTLPANVAIAGSVAVGTNPAQSGAIRLANNQAITAREVGNTADFDVIRLQPNNWVNVGNGTPLTIGGVIVATGGLILDGYSVITITERAAPSAPGLNSVNLWLQDNGAGKSQLMIQFATGAPIAIATQP